MGKERKLTQDELFDPKVLERVLKNIELKPETGCIEWTGDQCHDGYGRMSVGTRETQTKIRVHRWALQFFMGGVELPPEIKACHKCDNPLCCAPDHLFPGTNQDNMDDMVAKGRSVVSKGNGKLTPEQVRDVRYGGGSLVDAAERNNCSKTTASYIRSGRIWPEITNSPSGE